MACYHCHRRLRWIRSRQAAGRNRIERQEDHVCLSLTNTTLLSFCCSILLAASSWLFRKYTPSSTLKTYTSNTFSYRPRECRYASKRDAQKLDGYLMRSQHSSLLYQAVFICSRKPVEGPQSTEYCVPRAESWLQGIVGHLSTGISQSDKAGAN
jgi:hypothetical protein